MRIKLYLCLIISSLFLNSITLQADKRSPAGDFPVKGGDLILNYHLMHPGGDSAPGDPNAAFYIDGTYHLHYILRHPWQGKDSFSFVHVTSPDMLHWTWQPTRLQPSFTGHGMFSGTGFFTKQGLPAVIYHGKDSERNWIAIAKNKRKDRNDVYGLNQSIF